MFPKSPSNTDQDKVLGSMDQLEQKKSLTAQPKKDLIVEFNGGDKTKIRTTDGRAPGEECMKLMNNKGEDVAPDISHVGSWI